MYLELFKLKELPFRLSPDPQFLYLSKHHARAKAYMESTIWFTDGFVVITGEIGSGKTTLIETFLRKSSDVVVAQINQTQVSAVDFLQAVLVQFGFSPFKMKKAELIATLNNFLIEQYAAGRKVLLIVDEAQNLSLRVLEEIRLLSGVETTKEKVLRIILAGQPELNDKLDAPELGAARAAHAPALPPAARCRREEMRAYIQHRLEVAGAGDREIFAADTFAEIYRYTRRRAAADQHAVRHGDDGRLHRRPRHVTRADITSAVRGTAAGSSTRAHRAAACGTAETRACRARRHARRRARRRRPAARWRGCWWPPRAHRAELPLRIGRVIIGRTPDNDLQIDAASSAAITARSSRRTHSA